MNYTLNQLQIFLKVVQTMSVTKASEELNLTQPAVSIQLKNFQDQFDIPLTEVVGRKIYITEFGKEVAEAARQILEQVYAINYKTMAYKGHLFGQLKVSIVSTGQYIMPYFLSGFMKRNPSIELQMEVTNRAHVLERLERNEIDFALVSILPKNMNIEKIDLLQNKLYFVGKPDAKSKSDKITRDKLSKLPFICRENGSGMRLAIEKFLDKNELSINNKIELTSNEAVKQAILAGMGYSFMPLIGIRNEIQKGELQIIPFKGLPVKTMWSLIWLKGKKHSPVSQAYLQYIHEEMKNIVDEHFEWYEHY